MNQKGGKESESNELDATKKQGNVNVLLLCMLIFLIIAIVGLVIGIIWQNQTGEIVQEETQQQEVTEVDQGEISVGEDEAVNGKIAEIQERIAQAENDEDEVNLYWERIEYIWTEVGIDEYGEQVIRDVLAADDIQQSIESAYQVINAASMYGNEDLQNEYNEKLQERITAEGITGEGQGSDRNDE